TQHSTLNTQHSTVNTQQPTVNSQQFPRSATGIDITSRTLLIAKFIYAIKKWGEPEARPTKNYAATISPTAS
ncbi:hypothetical protein, partial [Microcoleus sp. LEGE 07076]|uniref:hypothetical protein n=1 Tax=Microcoleus sp. LEGE 07076 TaxID=915322 RepID=UPI001D13F4F6